MTGWGKLKANNENDPGDQSTISSSEGQNQISLEATQAKTDNNQPGIPQNLSFSNTIGKGNEIYQGKFFSAPEKLHEQLDGKNNS